MNVSETYRRLSDEASPLKPDYEIEVLRCHEDPISPNIILYVSFVNGDEIINDYQSERSSKDSL